VLVAVPRMIESLKQKIERGADESCGGGVSPRPDGAEPRHHMSSSHTNFAARFAAAKSRHFLRRWWTFRDLRRQFGWKFWAIISGGAALDRETEEFWHRLGYAVIQGYGLTETTSLISLNHPFHSSRGSIGKVLPGRELKLGEDGEIMVRGSSVASGYWNGRELQPVAGEDGWYGTGDLGALDAAGAITPRGKAMRGLPLPPRLARPEPNANGEHRLTVEGPGETAFLEISYHAPAGCDPDFFPLNVLDSLLAGPSGLNIFGGGGLSNKTSRLYRALVEKEMAVGVGGNAFTTLDPYLYSVSITVHPDRKPEQVLSAFDAEVKRIQDEPVPEEEISRAIKQARALFAYHSENITSQAAWLGHAEMFANYDWFLTYLDKLSKVTPSDIQTAAQKYLRAQNRVVGTYIPNGAEVQA